MTWRLKFQYWHNILTAAGGDSNGEGSGVREAFCRPYKNGCTANYPINDLAWNYQGVNHNSKTYAHGVILITVTQISYCDYLTV